MPLGYAKNTERTVQRATGTLPQTATGSLFSVTGKIMLTSILGEVTTVMGATGNNTKIVSIPTGLSAVDLCATVDTANDAVGICYNITGTVANALVKGATGVIKQATPLMILAGTISLSCAASNTGSVKWTVTYIPIDPLAIVTPL